MKDFRLKRLFNAKSNRCFDVAIDHAIERLKIGVAVGFAGTRRGKPTRIGLRILHALGRGRMRGQEVQRVTVRSRARDLQFRIAFQRR